MRLVDEPGKEERNIILESGMSLVGGLGNISAISGGNQRKYPSGKEEEKAMFSRKRV